MLISEIGKRGTLFTFQDGDSPMGGDTSVYLISGKERLYLCDTYLGIGSMKPIIDYIDRRYSEKQLVVFNSHSDFDHIWGNGAFPTSDVISHSKTRKRMQERWKFDYNRLSRFRDGEVIEKLPNITFNSNMKFEDDGIEFRYAPGHTACSSVCIDLEDSVIFAGDLIEEPVPVILSSDLITYYETLKSLMDMDFETLISAHSGVSDRTLLSKNIEYVKSLFLRERIEFPEGEDHGAHEFNVKHLVYLKYEDMAREPEGSGFNFDAFKKRFWEILGVGQDMMSIESKLMMDTPEEDFERAWREYCKE